METFPFVIVGHVDHGKSTLIGRLFFDTGCLPQDKMDDMRRICAEAGRDLEYAFVMDHLEEERIRGITIDTAQTFFRTAARQYVIIDAPGHREFLQNMMTGASQAEAAVLIVDALEGMREQTARHAYVLSLLGIDQVIVAINKMDAVDFRQERSDDLAAEVEQLLARTGVPMLRAVPISAKCGDNVAAPSNRMPWYAGPTLLQALDEFEHRAGSCDLPMRFPVQDVYHRNGESILVGRVAAGMLRCGQEVRFFPGCETACVAAIRLFPQEMREAEAGRSVGIVLADPLAVGRGAVACAQREPHVAVQVEATLFWLAAEPLRCGATLQLQLATQEVACTVETITDRTDTATLAVLESAAAELHATEVAAVQMRCENAIVVEDFTEIPELGRFVLHRGAETVGVGIVRLPASGDGEDGRKQ